MVTKWLLHTAVCNCEILKNPIYSSIFGVCFGIDKHACVYVSECFCSIFCLHFYEMKPDYWDKGI